MKRCLSVFVVLVLCMGLFSVVDASAKEINPESERGAIQEFLEQYFTELYSVLSDNTKNFSSQDFASTNGYIVGKELEARRYRSNKLFNGIYNVSLVSLDIEDISKTMHGVEVMVYVKHSWNYGMTPNCVECEGNLYRVLIMPNEDGYKVQDIDTNSIDQTMAKETLAVWNTPNIESNFEAVDDYFEGVDRNADVMSEMKDEDFAAIQEDDETEVSPRTGVSFNARKARYWGYRLGDFTQNYIFKRAALDCTNFVSQCVWAGYGGADGYTIPTNPKKDDATCIALKNRVKKDYRMTSNWYGRNFDARPELGDPPVAWCGVEEFYNYVTGNTGNGPKATGYNNGKVYSALSTTVKMSDVLQFYNPSLKRYSHSAIVVTKKEHPIKDKDLIKVAQHQPEKKARVLSEILSSMYYEKELTKIRLLRFKSTTF